MCLAKGHNAVTPVRLEPAILCVHYSFAIILMGKREFVALLSLSSWCLVIFFVWLFLAVPQVCLQFVIAIPKTYSHCLWVFSAGL